MNRILLLIIIGGLTFVVILFISRPDLWKDFWLWIVGLAGPIIKIADLIFKRIKLFFLKIIHGGKTKEAEFTAHQTETVNESQG